jgi:hypothetical protein
MRIQCLEIAGIEGDVQDLFFGKFFSRLGGRGEAKHCGRQYHRHTDNQSLYHDKPPFSI